uniref:Cadherin domain-containing protein n=1 Tax=Macrostomum lignano TaxID=282301 RepID=A0A1I8HEQ0_9PLAT
PNEEFEISGKILRTKKTFSLATDGPQYILVLTATDGGLPTLTGTATVTVNIVEANLVTPTFAVGSYTMSVPETTAVGASLYNASATDADHGLSGTVSYGLSSVSPVASYFAVDNKTGNVFLQNAIDYDTATSKVFELYIVAYDKGTPPRSNTFTLTVSITDANDNDPQFNTTNSFSKSIAENVGTGFVVNNIVTYDVDTGLGGNVTCSIASQSSPAIFAISTYSCVMTTTANPDREALAVHTVTVKLTDLGTPARTNQALFTITLTDLNDNTPTFSFAQMVTSVPENSAIGAAVTTVYATDADTGTNGAIAYSMISNDGAGDHGNFSISPPPRHHQQKAMYSLRVLATDSGSPPLTGTCVVNVTITDINDNTPTWVSAPYTASVSESAPLGELVITVSATDRDSTFGVLTYSIASGDTLGLFRINSATGRIETAKSSGLDRESVGLWNLTLVVNDNGSPPLSATTSLTVTVTDVNEFAPAWVNSSYNFRIIENSPVSTLVGNVRATDNDAGPVNNVIYYAIDAYLLGDNYFSISSTTGDISVSTAALDRETRDTYQLRVVAWDGATPSKTATNCLTVTIYIDDANDHDPVYSKSYYNATVKEDVSIGYNVLTVSGSDLDTGNNAVLIYRINTTDTAGAFASYFFNLDSSTGLLSVQRSLDRENSSYFHFPILIYDNGTAPQRSGSASVYIIVEDVNDNAPSLASFYNAEVPEVDDGNMKIATITATDPDTGSGGSVSYYWNSNTPYFNIDATTGIITRNTLNSVEEYKIYTQDVVARDSGSPQLTSSASKVRIDTFPADEYIVLIHFSMSEADYLSRLSTIKTNLAKTLVGKYPNN